MRGGALDCAPFRRRQSEEHRQQQLVDVLVTGGERDGPSEPAAAGSQAEQRLVVRHAPGWVIAAGAVDNLSPMGAKLCTTPAPCHPPIERGEPAAYIPSLNPAPWQEVGPAGGEQFGRPVAVDDTTTPIVRPDGGPAVAGEDDDHPTT